MWDMNFSFCLWELGHRMIGISSTKSERNMFTVADKCAQDCHID